MSATRLETILTLAAVALGVCATPAQAQPPTPSPSPNPSPTPVAACPRATNTCPPPSSGGYWVRINVVPNGNSCWFDPRAIPDLDTYVGGHAFWTFCSTCPVDTMIQLEVPGGNGPFDKFTAFVPQPDSANLVTLNMPCNGDASASGFTARSGGDWKYNLILQPTEVGQPLDRIDPRLEIDDFNFRPWMVGLAVLAGGMFAGAYFMRWRLRKRP